jgi:hypothetical protein
MRMHWAAKPGIVLLGKLLGGSPEHHFYTQIIFPEKT